MNKNTVNPKVPNGCDNPKETKMGEPVKPEPIVVLKFYINHVRMTMNKFYYCNKYFIPSDIYYICL